MQYKDFRDLEIWKSSRELRKALSETIKKVFPGDEKYKLADQIIRASRSVTANIAEGYGRYHYQENIQFCRQARGSLMELIDHLTVARDEEYIDKDVFERLIVEIKEILKNLNGYIKYLKSRKDDLINQ